MEQKNRDLCFDFFTILEFQYITVFSYLITNILILKW